jgi:L-fuconolactonase
MAECTNVVCKLSGLITRLPSGADFDVLKPWVHHIMTCFGTERVMIGSDYPVITQAATCAHWFAFLERELEVYSLEAQASLWGGTARRFYHLDLPEFAASERGLL